MTQYKIIEQSSSVLSSQDKIIRVAYFILLATIFAGNGLLLADKLNVSDAWKGFLPWTIVVPAFGLTKSYENESELNKNKNTFIIHEIVKNVIKNSVEEGLLEKDEVESLHFNLYFKVPRLIQLEFILNDIFQTKFYKLNEKNCKSIREKLENEFKVVKDETSFIKNIRLTLCGNDSDLSEGAKEITHMISKAAFYHSLDEIIHEEACKFYEDSINASC